jgi:hypothetical protein
LKRFFATSAEANVSAVRSAASSAS